MPKYGCGKWLFCLVLLLLILNFSMLAYAHPGRTDMYGGHTESATGIYHYHHGHEAHQHVNGVCPFGDYEQWLAEHGTIEKYQTEVLPYIYEDTSSESIGTWESIGIGVGGAAVASAIGYGVYRGTKKKRAALASQAEHQAYEYSPNMIVFIANNGSRYHTRCGCCNAMQSMELEEALNEGRTPCPTCCDESMIEYSVKLFEEEHSATLTETGIEAYPAEDKDEPVVEPIEEIVPPITEEAQHLQTEE